MSLKVLAAHPRSREVVELQGGGVTIPGAVQEQPACST